MGVLLGFYFLGMMLQYWGVPLPGNVIGLILFTACLFLGVVRMEWVERTAQIMLRHMLLFFAPVIVGALAVREQLGVEWFSIAVGLVGSFLVVLLVTGWTAATLIGHTTPEETSSDAAPLSHRPSSQLFPRGRDDREKRNRGAS